MATDVGATGPACILPIPSTVDTKKYGYLGGFLNLWRKQGIITTSRYVLLLTYCLSIFATGCCYWGWDGIQEILYKSGAFEWLCTNSANKSTLSVRGQDFLDCPERKVPISDMYSVAFSCHFGFSVLAGLLLDYLGPKFCGLIGFFITGLGWGLLAIGSQSRIGAYYAGAALLGAGADAVTLPLLSIGNLFVGNESLVLGIVGSVRSCSFSIPVIMSSIYLPAASLGPSNFKDFVIGYIGVGIGTAVAVSLLFVPFRPFKIADDTDEQAMDPARMEAAARSCRASFFTGPMMPPVSLSQLDLKDIVHEFKGMDLKEDYAHRRLSYALAGEKEGSNMIARGTISARGSLVGYRKQSVELAKSGIDNEKATRNTLNPNDCYGGVPVSKMSAQHLSAANLNDLAFFDDLDLHVKNGSFAISFLDNLKRPEFFLVVMMFCFSLLRGEFYTKSSKDLLITSDRTKNAYSAYSIMNILSFIPGPFFGKMCDSVGILWVVLTLNISGIFLYSFAIWDSIVTMYLSVVCLFFYNSFVLSNLYCYVSEQFPPVHFGKLTGFASLCGGLFTLSSLGLYRMSTGSALGRLGYYRFMPACVILIGLGLINCAIWYFLYRRDRSNKELYGKPIKA